MAIFRGTGGSGNSTDDSIVSAVTEQAGIATTKAGEAATSASTASTKASEASASATTASTKATEASTSATSAASDATAASNHETMAGVFRQAAQDQANIALGHANTANNASVQTVAGISTEVQNVNNIRTEIQNVDTIKTDVTTVAGISSNVTTVAADASDIGTVATNIANVNNVGDNISNVNSVAGNASNINTVAADGTDIGTVASNISNVNTVAGISSDVTTVAGLESKMDTVIADASDIGAVAGNIGDVTTVAGINSDVDTVAGIAAKVTTVADNITDVQNADTNAANASASASQAANSATAAGASATTASTKATEASNSATAASNSATTATTKASQAAGSATTAGTSASTATTKASEASASATTATTKAGEAASSASAASGSATTATTKAAEADASATSAASSATDSSNAASTWTNYYSTYLGAADAPPTVDVQGNALQTGAFYYDTGAGSNTVGLYVYNGSSWVYSTNYNNVTAPYSLSQDLATNSHDINFGDNAKAKFGAGNDLQIYHDTGNSVIADKGTGDLYLQGSNTIRLTNDDATEHYAKFNHNGGVELRHDNNIKFNTTATGIDVTGSALFHNNQGTVELRLAPSAYPNDIGSTARWSAIQAINGGSGNPTSLAFLTNGVSADPTERMRIDSLGNLLVGKTSADNTTEGCRLRNDGFTSFVRNGNVPTLINRLTNDGSLVTFQKDGTSVGSIGAQGGANLLIGNGDTGIRFAAANNAIHPWNPTTLGLRDAAIDLGADSIRFKDLHLSGTGYFGTSVGIGTASPSANLHVSSSGDTIARITSADGNSAFLDLGDASDPDGGRIVYDSGSNLALYTASTERMRINSSGNVGIGTSSPTAPLHVKSATDAIFRLESSDSNSWNYMEFQGNTARQGWIGSDNNNAIQINADNASKILLSGGNVGIGTTSPSSEVDISKASGGDSALSLTSAGVQRHQIIQKGTGDASLVFYNQTANAERMRIDSSGNLLVGKTSANNTTAGCRVRGDGFASFVRSGAEPVLINRLTDDGSLLTLQKDNQPVGSIGTTGGDMYVGTGDTGIRFDDATNHIRPCGVDGANLDATIDIGDSSRRFKDLRLSGTAYSDNLLVGTTSKDASEKVNITFDRTSQQGLAITNSSASAPNNATMVEFRYVNTLTGYIGSNGTTTSYNTSSDQRLKENIADADDAGSKIDAIQVRQFDWKSDGSHQDYGVIAQELQAVAPEAVSVPEDSEEMMGVDYSKLVPTLIKEIQTLRNRVAQLENN